MNQKNPFNLLMKYLIILLLFTNCASNHLSKLDKIKHQERWKKIESLSIKYNQEYMKSEEAIVTLMFIIARDFEYNLQLNKARNLYYDILEGVEYHKKYNYILYRAILLTTLNTSINLVENNREMLSKEDYKNAMISIFFQYKYDKLIPKELKEKILNYDGSYELK